MVWYKYPQQTVTIAVFKGMTAKQVLNELPQNDLVLIDPISGLRLPQSFDIGTLFGDKHQIVLEARDNVWESQKQ